MSLTQLSIPVGLLVENVLTSGEPIEVIIDCLRRRDFDPLLPKIKEPAMDLEPRLDTAAEIGENWEKAIREGYEFKFLHINGVKRLLDFRFDRKVDRDFVETGLSLQHVRLTREEIGVLRTLVGRQWDVYEEAEQNDAATDGVRLAGIRLKFG
ncbi:hypothetical protein [Paenibacillus sp. JJ-223]|uniref:hypothetical protein n=1 Tax=Paenibacillus sp. JJ-223 TaxID=2905647 RepID=UPI001F2D2897|nr:hypothetical protein [Paenibacillus sp. JJ-223]CAH1210044.1 hypothetical protein PAECIP111890_03399 [Paenibacillus sp. JJ-223]